MAASEETAEKINQMIRSAQNDGNKMRLRDVVKELRRIAGDPGEGLLSNKAARRMLEALDESNEWGEASFAYEDENGRTVPKERRKVPDGVDPKLVTRKLGIEEKETKEALRRAAFDPSADVSPEIRAGARRILFEDPYERQRHQMRVAMGLERDQGGIEYDERTHVMRLG